METDSQDGPLKKQTLFDLLSVNKSYANSSVKGYGDYYLTQAFRTAGAAFHVFEEDTAVAVAPYGAGKALIAQAAAWDHAPDDVTFAAWLTEVKPYLVTLYEYQKQALLAGGMVTIAGMLILQPDQYDAQTGVTPDGTNTDFLEV